MLLEFLFSHGKASDAKIRLVCKKNSNILDFIWYEWLSHANDIFEAEI